MRDSSWLGPPIDVRPLFAGQHTALLALLRDLSAADWSRPTACPGWTVHDVAGHVLGDHVGRLSIYRDGHHALHPRAGEPFPAFLHRINDEWVTAARRISPPLLIDLLAGVGEQIVELWRRADPDALAWDVSWAGPDPAPVWLDAARDFTEYWTHHQQIAEATGRAGPTSPRYLAPVLDTFLRALPHTLRALEPAEGTTVQVSVTGPAGGAWVATRTAERWTLTRGPHPDPDASIVLDPDTAWRLCTRGIPPERAAERAETRGDPRLTGAALQIVSIIY
jgi:uncharacterized protein (TIGR03083 family)